MLREVNELEYLSLGVGQPFNIAVMLKIKGKITVEQLETVFCKLQRRHPLLQVRLIFDEKEKPWFTSEGVGSVPIIEIKRKNHSHSVLKFHKELATPFDLDNKKLPLLRITLISSPEITELIICALHTIGDGFSMAFLVADMINYIVNPDEEIISLDFPKKDVDIFTPRVRRMIPKTSFYARVVYTLLRIYNFLRYVFVGKSKPAEVNVKEDELAIFSTKLTKDQTMKFLKRCKKEKVTVHSGISTTFAQEYPIMGSPVNLRERLNHNIGKSFGFYSGVTVYKMKYLKKRNFWRNAKRLQKKLSRSLRDRKLFFPQKLLSKATSLELLRKIGTYYIEIMTKKEPFSIDNLGKADVLLQNAGLDQFPPIESYFGGTTSFLNTFIVLLYTIEGEMNFYFHYTKKKYSKEEIKSYAKTIMKRLVDAINE